MTPSQAPEAKRRRRRERRNRVFISLYSPLAPVKEKRKKIKCYIRDLAHVSQSLNGLLTHTHRAQH